MYGLAGCLWWEKEGDNSETDWVIKGNISFRKGERICQVPGSIFNDATQIKAAYGETMVLLGGRGTRGRLEAFEAVMGALTARTLPSDTITVGCDKCGHLSRYRRGTLADRFGPDMAMPEMLNAIPKDCGMNAPLSRDVPSVNTGPNGYRALFAAIASFSNLLTKLD